MTDTRTIRIYETWCAFCEQCNDVCPVKCLHMSDEFLLANENRYAEDLIVE